MITMTRIHLIDIDSTITNLALAKIARFHKDKGDMVTISHGIDTGIDSDLMDKVYISCIYKKNKPKVDFLIDSYNKNMQYFGTAVDIDIGGSGYDLHKELPPEIEEMKPDYSLYPDNDYSIGFSSRGCLRTTKTCPWCIVPIKEGRSRRTQHPKEWFNEKYDKIVFLDNNALADKDWFIEVTDWCIEKDLSVWFTQGLDIRLLDERIAKQILKMKTYKGIFFAWDNLANEPIIREKIALLRAEGFTDNFFRAYVQFYCYVDNDSDAEYQSGLYRARELKKMGINAFIMYNIDNPHSQRITNLRRWCNKKWIFWSCDLEDYNKVEVPAAKVRYETQPIDLWI
jgi:hypothetical protein